MRRSGSATLTLPDGNLRIWIRLPGTDSTPPLATATLPHGDAALIERLIGAARRLIEQEVALAEQSGDIASCLDYLTSGLEEQSWLRSLSTHLTLCSASRSLQEVAIELLPSLRQLLKADSVAVLLNESTSADQPGLSPSRQLDRQILSHGPGIVEDQTWRDWIHDQPATPPDQPIVQNGARVNAALHSHRIQSFCAVPITQGEESYGWLVAVNGSQCQQDAAIGPSFRTSESDFGTVEAGLMGAAAAMLATHAHNVDLLQDREDLATGVIRAMGHAVDARDPYTRGHSERVGRYGRQLAEAIGLPTHECNRIYLSGLLHDVGKIGIPDAVLGKAGRLTDEEFAVIKQHPEIGARIVQTMPQLADLLPGVLHHHESVDGTGYPHALAGDAIPLMGRVLAVADAYDAMTSDRPYRAGMPRSRAVDILTSGAGTQWDKALVDAFLEIPESSLILEAVEGELGWYTDDNWLRSGAASMFGPRRFTGSSQSTPAEMSPSINLPPA